MAVDRSFIGYSLPDYEFEVSRERVERFASAIGVDRSRVDPDVAPLTFMKVIEGENDSSRRILDALGVELKRVMHAEQSFDYLEPIRIGERLRVRRSVTDIYDKKNGAMEFIVIEAAMQRQDGRLVGRSRQLVLVRNPQGGATQ